jgi:hypothetical protein
MKVLNVNQIKMNPVKKALENVNRALEESEHLLTNGDRTNREEVFSELDASADELAMMAETLERRIEKWPDNKITSDLLRLANEALKDNLKIRRAHPYPLNVDWTERLAPKVYSPLFTQAHFVCVRDRIKPKSIPHGHLLHMTYIKSRERRGQ